MVNRPGPDAQRGGRCVDAVRWTEMGQIEAVGEDHVGMRANARRREDDAAEEMIGDGRKRKSGFAAEPRPHEPPAFEAPIRSEPSGRQVRVARGPDARSVGSPAPTMKPTTKPVGVNGS